MKNELKSCWITLNRQCNLRCTWCYASETNYQSSDEININDLEELLCLLDSQNIKRVTLMGGEPTCYSNLTKVIRACRNHKIKVILISNGIKLADESMVSKLLSAGLSHVTLSLKGYNKSDFKKTTGRDEFDRVLKAIKNLEQCKIPFSVSMVLSPQNISRFIEGVDKAKRAGAERFSFSFCYDFSAINSINSTRKEYDFEENIFNIIDQFIIQYDEIDKITEGNFTLSQSFPLCAWPLDFIAKLESKNQLSSICQLLKHSGLIFDTNLNVIPCNAMYNVTLGQFKKDFNSPIEFEKFWSSRVNKVIFDKLRVAPSPECMSCKSLRVCGGGCVSHWFNFNFDEFKQARDYHYTNN